MFPLYVTKRSQMHGYTYIHILYTYMNRFGELEELVKQ